MCHISRPKLLNEILSRMNDIFATFNVSFFIFFCTEKNRLVIHGEYTTFRGTETFLLVDKCFFFYIVPLQCQSGLTYVNKKNQFYAQSFVHSFARFNHKSIIFNTNSKQNSEILFDSH